ncbi:integrator complex subunit 4-like [Lytechinus variegatus]|uniref:integrator complex subunit 4-like n=1 Tax=Lytechinus variegatus TaxID=7654 RepID=UPI001BB18837|nr:integrator complex subunit 4-like [Lytechinus variegatus]
MAAHLKKRAYEEFSQIIQDEPKAPPIKVRLVARPQVTQVTLDLRAGNSREALTQLLDLENQLPVSQDAAESIINTLFEHYSKEEGAHVRSKVIELLGRIARLPGVNAVGIANDLMTLLATEGSHKVKGQIFTTLTVIGRSLPLTSDLHRQLLQLAQKHLTDSNHAVRCATLSMIGQLGMCDVKSVASSSSSSSGKSSKERRKGNVQRMLGEFTSDRDARVREAAFQAMFSLHQRGQKLDLDLYQQSIKSLTDDHEGVRLVALKLVWVLSQVYPDEPVVAPGTTEETLRLVDDGFAKICEMVTDSSTKVRAEAAGLLGSLHSVSTRFLEQTLDKKLMSGLRKKKTAHERQKEQFTSGEWSTGKKWADDKPQEDVDPESVSLITSGACGAFVHGLEDEYLEVRSTALDSLCELAFQSPSFAILSLDFLVDMFNDEIESVRLNAIHSLRKINHHIKLREDQLEIILNVLDDSSKEVREALHELLSSIAMVTKSCLHKALMFLIRNLNKYPHDRLSIWNCLKNLGTAHPDLTLALVPDLLGTHPYFDTPEPDMDDPAYIAVMIMILNSAVNSPTMSALFPEYTFRHYTYLRDSLPHLVPEVENLQPARRQCLSNRGDNMADRQTNPQDFLQQTLDKLKGLDSLSNSAAINIMQLTVQDLQRISELEPKITATAQLYSMYIDCQLTLAKALSGDHWNVPAMLCPQQSAETALAASERVIELSYRLQHLYVGCSESELAMVQQLRLRAWALQLVVQLRGSSSNSGSSGSSSSHLAQKFLTRASAMQEHFSSATITPDSFTHAVFTQVLKLSAARHGILTKFLQPLLLHNRAPVLSLANTISRVSAVIREPAGGSDNPLRFTAGLTLGLFVDAELENVRDLERVRIQVRFPDSRTQLFIPRSSDFRILSNLRHRFMTEIYLSHGLWSEPSQVEVSIVMTHDLHGSGPSTSSKGESSSSSSRGTVELCKPVKVFLMPKPAKR